MGGKSTFLRQNALIVVLAQAGAFVPAASAKLGLVDRLFSRVAARDNLARGRPTFMLELLASASILPQPPPNSFVILADVARGTSTFYPIPRPRCVAQAGLQVDQPGLLALHEDGE